MALDTRTRPQQTSMHFLPQDQIPPQFTNPWVSQEQMNDAANNLHALSKPPIIRTSGVSSSPFLNGRTLTSSHLRHLTPPGHYPNPNGLMPGVSNVGIPAFTSAEMSMVGSSAPSPTSAGTTFMPSFSSSSSSSSYEMSTPRSHVPSDRRLSQPSMPSSLFLGADLGSKPRQASLTDVSFRPRPDLDYTSNGMDARAIVMSQPPRSRHDSGASMYHTSHSASSSISSQHSFPYYNGGSVDSSATDYSDGTGYPQERAGMMRQQQSLPRPAGYLNNGATVPNQMMTTFSSKITSSTQKKHKCKVCDKRFTRPSSLQTHTYSHTGEKPFACEHDGCGRRFSVVSNLRRHKKVHQGKKNDE
jgi:uncharacterized Zn-finger protein